GVAAAAVVGAAAVGGTAVGLAGATAVAGALVGAGAVVGAGAAVGGTAVGAGAAGAQAARRIKLATPEAPINVRRVIVRRPKRVDGRSCPCMTRSPTTNWSDYSKQRTGRRSNRQRDPGYNLHRYDHE